jgi:hypothetical protein
VIDACGILHLVESNQRQADPFVELQLEKAGVRLADLLDKSL